MKQLIDMASKALGERHELFDWYKRNASAKHGVPPAEPEMPKVPTSDPTAKGEKGDKGDKGDTGKFNIPWWAYPLLGAVGLGAGAGGIAIYDKLISPPDPPPAQSDSLLQSIEDRGFHLP